MNYWILYNIFSNHVNILKKDNNNIYMKYKLLEMKPNHNITLIQKKKNWYKSYGVYIYVRKRYI